MGNIIEFDRVVPWLSENLTFDVDARINFFKCNIRVFQGLISAHILTTSSTNKLDECASITSYLCWLKIWGNASYLLLIRQ
ncbi:hypothetical protein SLA2020_150210 [Shorea laevis]